MINNEKFIPTLQIALSAFSAIGYLIAGDYRKGLYWTCIAIATATLVY